MTTATLSRPTSRRLTKPIVAGLGALGAGVITAVVAVTSEVGVKGTVLENPHPVGPEVVGGVVRPHAPFLGIHAWPTIFLVFLIVVSLGILGSFIALSIRQRSMHFGLLVTFAAWGLSWIDPPANWVTFTVFDPRLPHFPLSWNWMRLAPNVEPVQNIPWGYAAYVLGAGWLVFKLWIRSTLSRSNGPAHPIRSLFLFAVGIGIVIDGTVQLLWMRADMYFYSQWIGPSIRWGYVQLPIVYVLLDAISFGACAVLFWRDDRGGSLMSRVGDRLPGLHRRPALAQIVAGSLFLSFMWVVPCTALGIIRVTGHMNQTIDAPWPYPEMKVYDPYGDLRRAGIAGPYYTDQDRRR